MAARWSTPSGVQWTIRCGSQQVTVVEVGGGLREYTVGGRPVIEGYAPDALASRGAGQVLAPWPNRLGDGAYEFRGASYQLPITEVSKHNASHGLVRWLAWQRIDQTPESVEVSCVLPPHPGYPFALGLTTRWTLDDDGLRADHTVANLGTAPAPFGFGAHPYLRVGDALIDDLDLHLPAAERLTTDDRLLPTGREAVAGTPFDFSEARAVGQLELDTTYHRTERDEDGIARTRLAATDGTGVALWQGPEFGWTQLFSGPGPSGRKRSALAVEPMTCPPDAFRSGEDLLVLAPGERWSGSWGIRPDGPAR